MVHNRTTPLRQLQKRRGVIYPTIETLPPRIPKHAAMCIHSWHSWKIPCKMCRVQSKPEIWLPPPLFSFLLQLFSFPPRPFSFPPRPFSFPPRPFYALSMKHGGTVGAWEKHRHKLGIVLRSLYEQNDKRKKVRQSKHLQTQENQT